MQKDHNRIKVELTMTKKSRNGHIKIRKGQGSLQQRWHTFEFANLYKSTVTFLKRWWWMQLMHFEELEKNIHCLASSWLLKGTPTLLFKRMIIFQEKKMSKSASICRRPKRGPSSYFKECLLFHNWRGKKGSSLISHFSIQIWRSFLILANLRTAGSNNF